jgi:hypothetical protein
MSVLTAPAAPLSPSLPNAAGPVCSLQRVAPQGAPGKSGSLWQLGIEAQELTTAIGQLAEQLESDDDDSRAQALAELEAALLAEEGNKQALAAKADATCWVIEHRGHALLPAWPQRLPDPLKSRRGRRAAGAGLMENQTIPPTSGRQRVWVTTAEACTALGMSRETLRQLRLRGVLTPGKHYRRWGCTQGRGPLQWHLENVEATITGWSRRHLQH